jgi:polar amino acid transport system substrate-binding protein
VNKARRAILLAPLAVVLLAAATLAGCATTPDLGTASSSARPAVARATAATQTATPTATQTATCDPVASSLAPAGPPAVTAGSFMARIRARGYLIAGVDQSTYHFGFLNPLDGQIEGFDIDMIKAVAQAIFGGPGHVRFKAISDAERMPEAQDGTVDIVAHTMTITCARLAAVDFSSVYFEAHQRLLVPADSTATSPADLAGKNICVTKGSDSGTLLNGLAPAKRPRVVPVTYWTDCLVMLEQDQVAAISTDDSILDGLQAQDPFTKVVGPNLTDEPYGLAIARQHPDFVRFVNAVLAAERADGAWAASYKRWIGGKPPPPPPARYATAGRSHG